VAGVVLAAVPAEATYSGRVGRLAFAVRVDNYVDIHTIRPDGTDPQAHRRPRIRRRAPHTTPVATKSPSAATGSTPAWSFEIWTPALTQEQSQVSQYFPGLSTLLCFEYAVLLTNKPEADP